ncbi:MAG: acetyl-CoA carboxylase, carboxyltransferase subunit beta [Coriobacteriia bacterium]|nr:acetyl-CoA carboxylase, carboxyltransferase subunit beta [Coriobacteriia bacterium]
MSITDWFRAREDKRYTPVNGAGPKADVPEGVWTTCDSCKRIIYEGELAASMRVCPYCGHHFPVPAHERIAQLVDEGSLEEFGAGITSSDPLEFVAAKSYVQSVSSAKEKSGLEEAVVTGRATIGGHPVIVAVMDFSFVGASMGSAVGEKITRAFEIAVSERRGIVFAIASGGARMQEGMLSLMQMAKTAAAAKRYRAEGLPYIAVLTNPTTGGVTASFATLADIIFAEPGALVGFAGPRLVEQATRQKLPKDFQSAEFLLDHGLVDDVVARGGLRERVSLVLDYLMRPGGAA